MGHGIDADVKADKDGAFVDVGNNTCILALNLTLAKVRLADIAVHAFDICLHENFLKGVDLHTQDRDQNLFYNRKFLLGEES